MFDDPNLVSSAGLVPVMRLAESAGLGQLAEQHLTVPTDKGANAGLKVASLVAGMVAGADSIDDMALLRHGGMAKVFARIYAPSTLGSFLRAFTFGHVRQLDAVASRFLLDLVGLRRRCSRGEPARRGAGGCWSTSMTRSSRSTGTPSRAPGSATPGVRGLNALLATVTTTRSAPVIVAQRLRKGSSASPRGAKRLVADAVKAAVGSSARPSRCWCGWIPRSTVAARCRGSAVARRLGHGPDGQASRPRSPPSMTTRGP